MTRLDQTRQKTRQDKTRQDKTRQDKTRQSQDKRITRQDKKWHTVASLAEETMLSTTLTLALC
jgi:hypothetical protein